MKIELNSIGTIKNNIEIRKDTDWGNDVSEIVLDTCYEEGLRGLSSFSHIIVVYYLDKANFNMQTSLIRRPQERVDMPMIGIFSQRAKDRPNSIGITSVELLCVKKHYNCQRFRCNKQHTRT